MNTTEIIHNRTAAEVMAETVQQTVDRGWLESETRYMSQSRAEAFRAGAEWARKDTEILMAHVKELRAHIREALAEIDAWERGEA